MTQTRKDSDSRLHYYLRKYLTLLGLAGALASVTDATMAYVLIDLGENVSPADINDNGIVVGAMNTDQYPTTAFRWENGVFTELAGATDATTINDAGWIAGNTLSGAFFYDGTLHNLGDDYTAGSINNNKEIAGSKAGVNPYRPRPLPENPAFYDIFSGEWSVIDLTMFYSRGTRLGVYTDKYNIFDNNDSGFAVGRKIKAGITGSSAFLVTPSKEVSILSFVPNGGYASAINNLNVIVGTTGTDAGAGEFAQAFLYDGSIHMLGTLNGGLTSSAADINEYNQVVGTSLLSTILTSRYEPEMYHAFLWDGQMSDLNTLPALSGSGWILTLATAINVQGDIVGIGLYDGDNDGEKETHGFLLSNSAAPPTPQTPPEPAPDKQPPVAVATTVTSDTGSAPLTVTFSGAGSSDPDGGAIVDYAWDFGDGKSSSGQEVVHIYKRAGDFTATLTVTDDEGDRDSTQLSITVLKRNARN